LPRFFLVLHDTWRVCAGDATAIAARHRAEMERFGYVPEGHLVV
jgi:hypothetical protein